MIATRLRPSTAVIITTWLQAACAGRGAIECAPTPPAPPPSAVAETSDSTGRRWRFDAPLNSQPAGFTLASHDGPAGRWVIRATANAPSGAAALAQEDSTPADSRFATAVSDDSTWRDLSLSVRCAMLGGRVDRACGIVWRYRDAKNYYLARANALEDNVRLYYVQDGRRREIAGWNGAVSACTWHTLRADMRGEQVEVYWDGQRIIDARDTRFPDAGGVGVWIKADSHTLFDDLVARSRP